MRIALLGGSFDPPHLVHQLACLYLLEGEGFDQVWILPCFRHAFGKPLVPFEHRVKMCSLMAESFHGRVEVSEVERRLSGGRGANRTVDTVAFLQSLRPNETFTFVIGSDIVSQTSAWKDFERLRTLVPFLVLRRRGWEVVESGWEYSAVMLPDVSSTEIRERLARADSVRGLVPGTVANYIREHSLYQAG